MNRLRRALHHVRHYPLSTFPVIDLARERDAYAMSGRCGNCNRRVAIVQAKGEGIPGFVSWNRLDCPCCDTRGAYGQWDLDLKAVVR